LILVDTRKTIDEENIANASVNYHPKERPPIPAVSMARHGIVIPNLLTQI
jgi:hypothetical protein